MSGLPQQNDLILGVDLGSRSVKMCVMRNGAAGEMKTFDSMTFYRSFGSRTGEEFRIDLDAVGFPDAAKIIATGYGRSAAAVGGAENISELTAHFLGARFQIGLHDFTLVDMGGQDYKVMRIAGDRIVDMATNDKCAASTGRYIENMARILEIPLEEMGGYSDSPVVLSSTCAIFGESELIGMIVKGMPVETLAAGVNRAVVERVLPLVDRMAGDTIVMSGGVSLNNAVLHFLREMSGRTVVRVDNPVHNGAIGCCVKGAGM